MKPILILLAVVALVVALIVWLASAGSSQPAAPAGPSAGIADAVSVQLDARVKATLAPRILAARNELQQLLASRPVDGAAADGALERLETLRDDVRRGREELAARGTAAGDIDAWLERSRWNEVQALADELSRAPRE